MHRSDGGAPEEQTEATAFATALSQLKSRGGCVLVAGSVSDDRRRRLSRKLFGTADSRMRLLVSTTGTWEQPPLFQDSSSAHLQYIRYQQLHRSTVGTQQPAAEGPTPATGAEATEPTPIVADELGELGIALSEALTALEDTATSDGGHLEAGTVRVGIDSLVPLLESAGQEPVFQFLHLIGRRTADLGGLCHAHLPVTHTDPLVSIFATVCDLLIECRNRNGIAEERWTLTDGGHCTGWIPQS